MVSVLLFFLIVPTFSQSVELNGPQKVTSSPCTDSNHLFLAPGVLSAGGTNRACVSRFYTDGPARMLVRLTTDDKQTATAARELPPGDGGCIDIAVPQRPNTKAQLIINLWYPEAQCSWERELTVRISSGRVLVVHTERARYRPGDILRARVLALKADLAPVHGVIEEIWLEGPRGAWSGTRAAQWQNVRARMGIAQIQHSLDELAPPGRWTVHARLGDGTQGSAAFMVGNYELPPFQLSVRHAQRVLRTSDRLVWTVCVRYPWTEAVEGMLVIRIRGAGVTSLGNEASGGIRTVVRIRAPRACHRHAAASRRIGLNGTNPPDVVVADFSFQEDGTRIWQNTTVVSQVVDKPISLEFLTKNRAVISPGLPYKLKVKATRWDDKPAGGVRVRVCRDAMTSSSPVTSSATSPSCSDADTDAWGVARLTFTASDAPALLYTFQASLANDSATAAPPIQIRVRRAGSAHAALGPIRPDTESGKTFVPLYVNLKNVTKPITVHFVVITRGGIIYRWGATTQCPLTSSADYIPTTSRNSQCLHAQVANLDTKLPNFDENLANTKDNTARFDRNLTNTDANMAKLESDSLVDRHLLRVMLPIKVTHQMCPDSHLIAFFDYKGELVSASKHFEMEECFINKVELTWLSRQVAPGSLASLQISTTGPALCALTVLDSAAKWNQPTTSVKDVLMTGLRRLMHSHRNLTEYDAAGACFLTSDSPELPTDSLELTATWLASAGVRITGGGLTHLRTKCASGPAPLIDDATVPRSDFSEAWLWRLVGVGSNGSATVSGHAPDSISRFEASASCLSRTGFASAPPAVLQVFREFFIHADGPRRLKRGDATIVRYRLFNYLYESLSVQIQILTDSHLEAPTEHVEAACVGARTSIARRVEVKAKAPGDARLSVRAKAVQDGSCGNNTSGRAGVSDEVIISITVELEGVPQEEHKSILLCGRGSPEAGSSAVSWAWPAAEALVDGSEALAVWVAGDVTGPLLADADALVTLPRGCGEQNMARLATNLLALTMLPPSSPAYAAAKEHVARGVTRQLQYLHSSGGFSAFGRQDAEPSTWLTAFTLRYLRRAHQVMNPGLRAPAALSHAECWLLAQQMENGCFRNSGQVFHRELRGGLNEEGEIASVALTAYVITSLLESSAPVSARVLYNALSCLRALPPGKTRSPTRVYAQALLGYAFMRIRRYEDEIKMTNEASLLWVRREAVGGGLKEDEELRELMELLKMARRNGDHVWWETSSLSTSIEATGYALLALSLCPRQLRGACAQDARGATRWLSAHRGAGGGLLSTQDTLVALEALAAWSSVQPPTPPSLTVTARSRNDVRTMVVNPGDKVPELIRMAASDQLDVSVEGTGCALVQATRSYHSSAPPDARAPALWVQVAVHTDGVFDCDTNNTYCACAAVIEACASWTDALPSMWLLEVRLPGAAAADAARLYRQLRAADPLLRRIELTPSGGRATFYLGDGGGAGGGGHVCYVVHAVAPRAKTKPAYARVIDYYTPTRNHTQMYTIPEDCPPRIAHEANEFAASDNLFNKAKSLTDSGEILITHEFSYEDIPEGIPLKDPIYDTFNGDEIAYLSKFNEIKQNPSYQNITFENNNNKQIEINYQDNKDNLSANKPLNDAVASETIHVNAEIKSSVDPNANINTNLLHQHNNKDVQVNNAERTASESSEIHNNFGDPTNSDRTQHNVNQNNADMNSNYDGSNNDGIRPNGHVNATIKETIKNIKYGVQLDNNGAVANSYDDTTTNIEGIYQDYLDGNKETTANKNYENNFEDQSNNYDSDQSNNKYFHVTPNNDGQVSYVNVDGTDQSGYVNVNNGAGNQGNDRMDLKVDNPNLSHFHVIDSATDLDVPTGMEGPVPSIVLPPPNFVVPPPASPAPPMNYQRRFQTSPQKLYFFTYIESPTYGRYYSQAG